MKTKKLNQDLFSNMELNNADLKEVKGGATERVYSGSGPTGDGRTAIEWCCVSDDGKIWWQYNIY